MSALSKQLVALRKKHNWTQKALAHTVGITQGYMCQIERGDVKSIGAYTLLRLADAFQVPLDYFREAIEEDANAPKPVR